MLSRDQILSKINLKKETVNIPEWEGDVCVSEMSGAARDEWEQTLLDRDAKNRLVNPRAKLIIACVVDENGTRMFADKDAEMINKLSANSLEKICNVAQKLNKLLAEDLDTAAKN